MLLDDDLNQSSSNINEPMSFFNAMIYLTFLNNQNYSMGSVLLLFYR